MNLFSISEIKISYNPNFKPSEQPKIKSSEDAYNIFNQQWDPGDIQHRESFAVLLLNRANNVIGIQWVSKGGTAGTVADPKMIFQTALKANASSLILCHNHPSGNTRPSQNDIDLTKKCVNAGKLLDLSVLDHLILTVDSFYSFADEGII